MKFAITLAILTLAVFRTPLAAEWLHDFPSKECFRMAYSENLFRKGAIAQNYEVHREIRKYNVLCIGDHVRINRPLYTNGGSVLILADKVTINAAIDTRIYFNIRDFDPFESPDDALRRLGGRKSAYTKLTETKAFKSYGGRKHDPRVPNLYSSYYTRSRQCVSRKNAVFKPMLPPGLTPARYIPEPETNPVHGLQSPENKILWSAVKSGNVYIYSDSIEFQSPDRITREPKSTHCDSDTSSNILINVSGSRGGFGGAGLPSPCTGHSTAQFDCTDNLYNAPGGKNAKGQRGADAGIVEISLTNTSDSLIQVNHIDVTGGISGDRRRFQTPSGRGKFAIRSKEGNFSDFFRIKPDWPEAKTGKDGRVILREKLNTTALLINFNDRLREFQLSKRHNFAELAERAVNDRTIMSVDFFGFYNKRLNEILIGVELSYLSELFKALRSKQGFRAIVGKQENVNIIPKIFRELNLREFPASGSFNEIYRLMTEIAAFDRVQSRGPVTSYFINTGGLFNLFDTQAYQSLLLNTAASRIESVAEILERISANVNTLEEYANDQLVSIERARFERVLKGLESAFKEAIEKSKKGDGLFQKLTKVGEAIGRIYKAYQSTNGIDVAKGIYELVSATRNLVSSEAFENSPEALKRAIIILQNKYRVFLSDMLDVKQQAIFERISALKQGLRWRSAASNSQVFAAGRFHSLLRSALITYMADPSRSLLLLQNNLISIINLLRGYPEMGPGFRFLDPLISCTPGIENDRCKELESFGNWTVYSIDAPRDVLDGFPVIVMSPKIRAINLNTLGYGLRTSFIERPRFDTLIASPFRAQRVRR